MKKALTSLIILSAFSTAQAQKALEITSGFENQKIAALEAYLTENPEAQDRDTALAMLVGANMTIGKFEPLPDLLTRRYDAQPKGLEADLQVIVQEIARPLIEASMVSNQRDKAKAFITRVKADLADHPQSAQVSQFLDQVGGDLYLPGVGDEMKIAFTDLNGKEIDLEKMKDKVILVDFWATWCGPCIAEMPNVTAAYETYKDKGFEVVGISLDEDKAAVVKFIADNKMPWPQFVDGKGWENELAQRFGIRSIPATFLVGKGGRIVASNLRGPDLEAAIEKALAGE
ncbi:MAG: TlpA family protein disulfide reductase [Verrucomicrobiales bacterium]|jgi:thiol-disulfide isomerase/thioredoxin|nr:TlpA family protein disulfide reductase [Verrucomicrobiales bacterium]